MDGRGRIFRDPHEAALRHSLCRLLSREDTWTILEAAFLKDAVPLLDEPPQLIISDLDLPDGSGLELLSEIASRGLKVPVIVITAHLSRFRTELAAIRREPSDPLSAQVFGLDPSRKAAPWRLDPSLKA
jgi:DNA-binding NtrC family response regulator